MKMKLVGLALDANVFKAAVSSLATDVKLADAVRFDAVRFGVKIRH